MYRIQSKRTGREETLTNEQYAEMLKKAPEGFMKRFNVTEVNLRSMITKPPVKLINKK